MRSLCGACLVELSVGQLLRHKSTRFNFALISRYVVLVQPCHVLAFQFAFLEHHQCLSFLINMYGEGVTLISKYVV